MGKRLVAGSPEEAVVVMAYVNHEITALKAIEDIVGTDEPPGFLRELQDQSTGELATMTMENFIRGRGLRSFAGREPDRFRLAESS